MQKKKNKKNKQKRDGDLNGRSADFCVRLVVKEKHEKLRGWMFLDERHHGKTRL